MIHFFPNFSSDPSDSPLARELRALGVEHRLFGERLTFRYRSRLRLLLVGWPRMLAFAFRSAWRSLVRADPRPDVVVLGSHIEVLVFSLLSWLTGRGDTTFVLLGFIYTTRRSPLLNALRQRYFRFVFSHADLALCHSSLEVQRYEAMFGGRRARFVYMPYGMHVGGSERRVPPGGAAYLLSAGRSGRDYATLFQAVAGLDVEVRVICDREAMLAGLHPPSNVRLLRHCYGDEYVEQLRGCALVVVPLAVDDISAGQMVLIQALSFAKPTIITDTPTVREYVTDGRDAVLVPLHDPSALRRTIETILADPPLAARLGASARHSFEERFSMRAYVRNLLKAASVPMEGEAAATGVANARPPGMAPAGDSGPRGR